MSLFNQLTFGVGAQFKTIFNLNAAVYICHAGPFLSDKFFDLTGSCSYAIAALQGYFARIKQQQRLGKKKSEVEKGNLRAGIATAGVLIWAVRLGTFLFTRISRDGVDSRQDSLKASGRLLYSIFWFYQVFWCSVVGLPAYLTNKHASEHSLDKIDYLGMTLWLFGFGFEALADQQKRVFANAGYRETKGFITSGVWSMSRHPNYAGEIILWLGMSIFGWNSVRRSKTCPVAAVSFLSPAWTYYILNYFSGIPLLERKMRKKFKNNPEFQQWLKKTPILFPIFGSV